jgi:hypothetical protein
MKLKYFLAISGLSIAALAQAQSPQWATDTVDMQAGYARNVYYSLENGTVKSTPENQWDIAIRSGLMNVGVYANHAGNGAEVYPLTGLSAATHFGTDLTADTAGLTGPDFALYNSVTTWDTGAFNQDRDPNQIYDLGWGTYEPTSHVISGDKIYLLVTNTGAYQVWIESDDPFNVANPPEWTFHICNLYGSDRKDKTLNTNPDYSNKLFAYYNIANDTFLNIDPDLSSWDLLFTRYKEMVSMGPVSMMYPVTGVLSNQDRPAMEIRGEDALTATWDAGMATDLSSVINVIGRDWKLQPDTNGLYTLDTVTYFMKVPNNDIWQLEFTYASQGNTTAFPGLVPGRIILRKRKVFDHTTAIKEVNPDFNTVLIAPNPASATAYLVLDPRENIKDAQIRITDIAGRLISSKTRNIAKGLQHIPLNLSAYPAGIYLVNITANGHNSSQKLIVQ